MTDSYDRSRNLTDLAEILAAGYLRLLRQRAANRQPRAHLEASDSSRLELLSAAPEVMYQGRDNPATQSTERGYA